MAVAPTDRCPKCGAPTLPAGASSRPHSVKTCRRPRVGKEVRL